MIRGTVYPGANSQRCTSWGLLRLIRVQRHYGDVTVAENRLVMTICDNGQGFSAQDPKADRLGLSIMKERAEAVGAVFELHSVPGSGTTISVLLPIEHAISPR